MSHSRWQEQCPIKSDFAGPLFSCMPDFSQRMVTRIEKIGQIHFQNAGGIGSGLEAIRGEAQMEARLCGREYSGKGTDQGQALATQKRFALISSLHRLDFNPLGWTNTVQPFLFYGAHTCS